MLAAICLHDYVARDSRKDGITGGAKHIHASVHAEINPTALKIVYARLLCSGVTKRTSIIVSIEQ